MARHDVCMLRSARNFGEIELRVFDICQRRRSVTHEFDAFLGTPVSCIIVNFLNATDAVALRQVQQKLRLRLVFL